MRYRLGDKVIFNVHMTGPFAGQQTEFDQKAEIVIVDTILLQYPHPDSQPYKIRIDNSDISFWVRSSSLKLEDPVLDLARNLEIL